MGDGPLAGLNGSARTLTRAANQPTAPRIADDASPAQMRQVADKFEAMFITEMLNTLDSTMPGGMLFGQSSKGGQMFASMLNEAYAERITADGGFGLADAIYRDLAGTK